MSEELLYTSAPQGLQPGSHGFCTVVRSAGLPKLLGERLESLSGYRHATAPHSGRGMGNPVNFSHLVLTLGGQRHHVLSRIADAGLDYTGRSNKLAHHVVLAADELVSAGPAGVLAAEGFCETSWDGRVRELPDGRRPPRSVGHAGACSAWQEAAGDAGWAGVLAETALDDESPLVSVIVRADQSTLRLVVEANGLLPESRRWDVTFSTFFTRLPAGVECQWRFLLDGTPEARTARRNPHNTVIDLCRSLPAATGGPLVDQARTGRPPEAEPVELSSDGRTSAEDQSPDQTIAVGQPKIIFNPPIPSPDMTSVSSWPSGRRAILAGVVTTLLLVVAAAAVLMPSPAEPVNQLDTQSDNSTDVAEHPVQVVRPQSGGVAAAAAMRKPFRLGPPLSERPLPAIRPGPDEPRPLDVIRSRRFAEIPLPPRGLNSSSRPRKLFDLDVSPDGCELQLHGSEQLLVGGRFLDLVGEGAGNWGVRLKQKNALGKGTLIGRFILADGKLSFGWKEQAVKEKDGLALRKCVLVVRVGDDREHVFLSSPKEISAIVSGTVSSVSVDVGSRWAAEHAFCDVVAVDLRPDAGRDRRRRSNLGLPLLKSAWVHFPLAGNETFLFMDPSWKKEDRIVNLNLEPWPIPLPGLRPIRQPPRIHLRCYLRLGEFEVDLVKTIGWDNVFRSNRLGMPNPRFIPFESNGRDPAGAR